MERTEWELKEEQGHQVHQVRTCSHQGHTDYELIVSAQTTIKQLFSEGLCRCGWRLVEVFFSISVLVNSETAISIFLTLARGSMFIIMLSAVDYSFFKSRHYSGANPRFPQQQLTKSPLKNPSVDTPTQRLCLHGEHSLKEWRPNKWTPSLFLTYGESVFQQTFHSPIIAPVGHYCIFIHKGHVLNARHHFISCNFRCNGHSWRWQGWPKRRTWGDRNSRHPRGVRSEGTLWVTRTLWPINLFKQNSSSLHVQRKEVCKLQKSLKSQLNDKLQIPSCYQDPVLGLLQTSRCGCGSNVPTWNHGFQETTQRETETRHRCRTLYRCLILWFYDWSCFSSWGQVCRTISVQYNIKKTTTHQHAHTRVIN